MQTTSLHQSDLPNWEPTKAEGGSNISQVTMPGRLAG